MMTENSPSLDGFRMWKSAMLLFVFVSLGECEVQFELWCSMVRHFWCEPNMTPSSSDEIIVYVLIHLNQMWPNDESVSGKNKIYSNVFFIVWKLKTQFELSSSTFSLQFATVITHFTRLDAAMGRPEEKKAIGNNKKWKISTKKWDWRMGKVLTRIFNEFLVPFSLGSFCHMPTNRNRDRITNDHLKFRLVTRGESSWLAG